MIRNADITYSKGIVMTHVPTRWGKIDHYKKRTSLMMKHGFQGSAYGAYVGTLFGIFYTCSADLVMAYSNNNFNAHTTLYNYSLGNIFYSGVEKKEATTALHELAHPASQEEKVINKCWEVGGYTLFGAVAGLIKGLKKGYDEPVVKGNVPGVR